MRYQNRQPAEGVNVTRHNPLFYFLKLLLAALVLIILLVAVTNIFAARIGRSVPFNYETSLMDRVDYEFGGENSSEDMQSYLSDLASRLIPFLNLPEGMTVQVHHNNDEVFNAFATLGGNIVFYSGLLESLPHENALAMVMAHEISHVIHRDPIAGLGGGLATMMALTALTGSTGTNTIGKLLNRTGSVTQSKFGRDMERAADEAALGAVAGLYGHVSGASELFRILQDQNSSGGKDDWYAAFTATHPLNENRIKSIEELADENGWSNTGSVTPLPADFKNWLKW